MVYVKLKDHRIPSIITPSILSKRDAARVFFSNQSKITGPADNKQISIGILAHETHYRQPVAL